MPRSFRAIFALIMREMTTTYGKSSAGYLWAILEPVGGIFVLSVAFSVVMRSPALGESFPLFYATGFIPFSLYGDMQAKIGGALQQNKQLLFYPRVTYTDAIISRFLLTMVTQFLVALIVFFGVFYLDGIRQHIDLVAVCGSLLIAGLVGLGVGTFNCAVNFLVPSWKNIWKIINRPMFIISGVIFLYDNLPDWVQTILWYNPLVHVIGLMRIGIFSSYQGDYVSVAYPIAVGSVLLLVGLLLLRRFAQDLLNS